MQKTGSTFLHEQNPNFHSSREVQGVVSYLKAGGEPIPNEPADKISAYIGFLANEECVNDGILTGDEKSIERQVEANVIKSTNVPESYFDLQRRIARERGYGDIAITDDVRGQLTEAVQADQRSGLGKWAEYLASDDGNYPNWFRHYAFDSVTKLGNYDKTKGEFQKRTKSTTAAYPELNREALAYVYDTLNKAKIQGQEVDAGENTERLQNLLQHVKFGKLYSFTLLESTPASKENLQNTKGEWVKYDQIEGDYETDYELGEDGEYQDSNAASITDETAVKLAQSLQGHGTGWCTAGESTAATQLSQGDFYVYYSDDEAGKPTIPRIAIRMEGDQVAEVRGIDAKQEMEPLVIDIAKEKLAELPGGEEYEAKADDMKRLTALDELLHKNPEAPLSRSDLKFIFEYDYPIEGFGYNGSDPRTSELRDLLWNSQSSMLIEELKYAYAESLEQKLPDTYAAYKDITAKLGIEAVDLETTHRLLQSKMAEWMKDGLFPLETYEDYQLVAVPNIVIDNDQLRTLLKNVFSGYMDSYAPAIPPEFDADTYDMEEISGEMSDDALRFVLIPVRADERRIHSTEDIDHLRGRVGWNSYVPWERQRHVQIPSVYESIASLYVLRERGYIDEYSTQPRIQTVHADISTSYEDDIPVTSFSRGRASLQTLKNVTVNRFDGSPEYNSAQTRFGLN